METDEANMDTESGVLLTLQQYHLPAFVAGVALILFLVVLNRGMQSSIGLAVVGEEIVTPVRIALIGLGTGYYLADALKKNNSAVIAFHVGAFLALLSLATWSIQIQPVGLVLGTAVLFTFSMNISSLVDSYDEIRRTFDALARDISRAGLIFVVFIQYSVSLYFWSDTQLSSFSALEQTIILIFGLIILYLSIQGTRAVMVWQRSEE
ncbi:hypothetical protein NGM10_02850 [Halorussus salilacus]|uniref:hypothetical protein n=1 Tax=Halorussus salilacus TaxID=2953750 RepID=UPI00209CC16A|nr:hypothetical protein [Halorussus salilacus]USZ68687.1 hypothetical protein NGM10_02850 [Halorussus salilacus]